MDKQTKSARKNLEGVINSSTWLREDITTATEVRAVHEERLEPGSGIDDKFQAYANAAEKLAKSLEIFLAEIAKIDSSDY